LHSASLTAIDATCIDVANYCVSSPLFFASS
jgi:hypothetical protein